MSPDTSTTPGASSGSLLRRGGWRLEKRLEVKPWHEVVTLVGAFIVGLALCSILIAASDKSVIDSYRALFDGALGSSRAIYETLVQATPLIFTGLAAAFAFRARVWNIGGEGQFFAGAMGAYFVSDLWSAHLPGGVMVPVVNTPEEAAAVVQAAKFPPRGIRSKGGMLHAAAFNTNAATYYERANDETLVSVQLETREAILRAEEILSVDGVDVVSVGPNDLAASFGYAEADAWQQDDFVNAIHGAVTAAERTGKAAGIAARTVEQARERAADGYRMVTLGTDLGILADAAGDIAQELGLG